MRSGMTRWAAAGAVLLLNAALGVAQTTAGGKLPPDLALVPRDGSGFALVRVAELWEKAEGLRTLAKTDPLLLQFLKEADNKFGLAPQDIERALVIFPDAPINAAPVVVLTLAKPYDKEKLLQKIVPDGKNRTVGNKKFRIHMNNCAVHLVNDRTFLLGSVRAVEDFFRLSQNPRGLAVLDPALAEVDKHDIYLGLNLANLMKNPSRDMKPYVSLLSARGATLTVDFTATTMRLAARIPCATEDGAREAEQLARRGIEFLPKAIPVFTKGDGPLEFKEGIRRVTPFVEDVLTGLRSARVTREDHEVRVEMTVATKDPATGAACTFCTFLAPMTVARSSPPTPPKTGSPVPSHSIPKIGEGRP